MKFKVSTCVIFVLVLVLFPKVQAEQRIEKWAINGTPSLLKVMREYSDGPGLGRYIVTSDPADAQHVNFNNQARIYPVSSPVCQPEGFLGIAWNTTLKRDDEIFGQIVECITWSGRTKDYFVHFPTGRAVPITKY